MKGWDKNDTHFGPSNLQYGFNNKIWGLLDQVLLDFQKTEKNIILGPVFII